MAANTNTVSRPGRTIEVQDSVTRPNDSTQYAVGDAISDNATTATAAGAFTLDFGVEAGSGVAITDLTLHKSDTDLTAATFTLLLFDALPALAGWEDNGASAITDLEMQNCKAAFTFPAAAAASSGGFLACGTGDIQTITPNTPVRVVLASGSRTLYGILLAGATYTPAANEVFTLTVHAVPD